MAVTDQQRLSYIASQAADARLAVELQTEEMTLNLGPQHPATHGTLRIVAKLDGEQVVKADVICGYMHRGYEKLTEVRTYPQINTLINRIDLPERSAGESATAPDCPSRACRLPSRKKRPTRLRRPGPTTWAISLFRS